MLTKVILEIIGRGLAREGEEVDISGGHGENGIVAALSMSAEMRYHRWAMENDLQSLIPDQYVRRPWCVRLAIALLVLGAVLNLFFLYHNCPFDLSDDECHYWEWSRHLDYGYYSKPPGIAWVIGAAAYVGKVLGVAQTAEAMMPVIRTPAVVFGFLSGLLSWGLTRRIFRDDRAGLMVLLLSAAVPMFSVGSLLITIDSPMYLCWGAAVYALWRFVEGSGVRGEGSVRWLYLGAWATSMGMLFKPVLIAVPLCAGVAAWWDPGIRAKFKTWHVAGAMVVVLLSQVPVVMWNAQHDWVTFRHIGTQGGFAGGKITHWYTPLARLGEYVGGQAGGMAGMIFVLLVIAMVGAVRTVRAGRKDIRLSGQTSGLVFLLAFALPLWLFYLVMNVWTSTELNWPAASYFAAMALLGGVCSGAWNKRPVDRGARAWIAATIVWGVAIGALAQNFDILYPMAAEKLAKTESKEAYFRSAWHPRKWDLSLRLKAAQERADVVQKLREEFFAETGQEPLLAAHHYGVASSLAFHLPDQPMVFCIQSNKGGRHSQYDLWEGLNEVNVRGRPGELVYAGANVLVVGVDDPKEIDAVIRPAFERMEGPFQARVDHLGINTRNLPYIRGYGFKGLPEHAGGPY